MSAFRRRLKQQFAVLNTVCPLQGRGNLPSVLDAEQLEGATLDQEILLSSRQTLGDKNNPLPSFFSSLFTPLWNPSCSIVGGDMKISNFTADRLYFVLFDIFYKCKQKSE